MTVSEVMFLTTLTYLWSEMLWLQSTSFTLFETCKTVTNSCQAVKEFKVSD